VKIIGNQILHSDNWIKVLKRGYLDKTGREKSWTYIERSNGQRAAVIVAVTRETGTLILISQFRVPFGREIIEFPAGLIDPGETAAQTAERELMEETGYRGRVVEVGPPISTSCGLTTELIHLVYMEVDEQPAAAPRLESSEKIRVLKLKNEEFPALLDKSGRDEILLDAKVYVYLREMIPA
jgi:ADP-ribose pyrophosphatase